VKMEITKKRKPLLALVISLIQPCLGQVYNGQLLKGVILYSIGIVIVFLISFTGLFFEFYGFIIGVVILVGFFMFILVDAFINARRIKELKLKPYNRWYFYILLILIMSYIIEPLFQIETLGIKPFQMPSSSMSPTLIPGDYVVTNLKAYKSEKPRRGDIVAFIYPKDTSKHLIKRVIGLGGDKIEIKDKKLYLNDELYNDPYAFHADNVIVPRSVQPRDNFGPVIVPKGSYFVLGDNRDRSADSRFWGYVSEENLKGQAAYIYWSNDKRRLGKTLL